MPQRTELKSWINADVVRDIARRVKQQHAAFDHKRFIAEVSADLPPLALLARSHRIARALHDYLPRDYEAALKIVLQSMDAERPKSDGFYGFELLPYLNFVGDYGVDHPAPSLRALASMTRLFSAEFDIRPFLVKHQAQTLKAVRQWARDPDWRVRRLASEGIRPRLPWGLRLRAFIENPLPVLEILELLRRDPHENVRRSVANNLNDIAKDHPDLVLATAQRWWADGSPCSAGGRTVRPKRAGSCATDCGR
jgi:3-methyladenine DNA glycosylase AlkC